MADDMTPGEIARTFNRQDAAVRATNDRIAELARESVSAKQYETAQQALSAQVSHLETDTATALTRSEAAAVERHRAIGREIRDLKELVEREIADLRGTIAALREERRRRGEATWQKWTAALAAIAAVALVVVTLLGQGGH